MLQLHIQSLLLAVLHDQLIIVVSKINLLLALISIEKHCRRSNHAQNNQTVEAQATRTPVGLAGNPELGQIRHHLSIDEKDSRDNRRERLVYGSRHGNDSRPFHSREDVDTIKPYNVNHRHPENTTKLERIPNIS